PAPAIPALICMSSGIERCETRGPRQASRRVHRIVAAPERDAPRMPASQRGPSWRNMMIPRTLQLTHRVRCAITVANLSLMAPLAAAEETGAPNSERAREPAPIHLMALTAPARLAGAAFSATTWAGYDAAIENPRVRVSVEADLTRRLAIAVGADSASGVQEQFTLRPLVAMRFQVLEQNAIGVDATTALAYRQDRFD